ncbi:MAG: caspase family protein [Pseudomonadota bacterium]
MRALPKLVVLLLAIACSDLIAASRGLSVTFKESEATGAKDAGEMQLYSGSYALVIGIDSYNNGWPRLSNAIADANKVSAALRGRGFEVQVLTDLDSGAMEDAFEDFFIDKGADPEARLFVWFAGHGHTTGGEGYLIPSDGVLETDMRQFKRKSLSLRRFGEFVRLAESKHVYTIFDSCFAGTIFSVARSAPPPAITRVTSQPTRQFLTSGDAGQAVSDDGTFAALFVEAIEGRRRADLNLDGYVTAEELGSFMTTSISNYSNNKQVPRHGKLRDPAYDKGDFVFLATGSTVATASPVETPSFSIADLRQANSAQTDWGRRQQAMDRAWADIQNLEREGATNNLLIQAWERFVTTFADDNPFSNQDEVMRNNASTRLASLKRDVSNDGNASTTRPSLTQSTMPASTLSSSVPPTQASLHVFIEDKWGQDETVDILVDDYVVATIPLARHYSFTDAQNYDVVIPIEPGEHSVRVGGKKVDYDFRASNRYELRVRLTSMFGTKKILNFEKLD